MRVLEERLIVCPSIAKGDVPRTAWGQCVKRFMRGYSVTSDNEEAPSSMLGEVSETHKTKHLAEGHTCTSSAATKHPILR